jgi:dTDP-4-dehydrorhamnose 3,5-epimerase
LTPPIIESDRIQGVYTVQLRAYADERGRFLETFRKEWFPQRSWEIVQSNRSDSAAGVLRGLHYHHHQVDYWYVQQGRIRAGLFDLRPQSPTRGAQLTLDMDGDQPLGLYIPVGVAHGFVALTDVTLTYIVDNYYDGADECGVAWDDREVGISWGITTPRMSARDLANPRLKDIPAEALPAG